MAFSALYTTETATPKPLVFEQTQHTLHIYRARGGNIWGEVLQSIITVGCGNLSVGGRDDALITSQVWGVSKIEARPNFSEALHLRISILIASHPKADFSKNPNCFPMNNPTVQLLYQKLIFRSKNGIPTILD